MKPLIEDVRVRPADIARRRGVTTETVRRHIKRLEAEGKIRTDHRPGGMDLDLTSASVLDASFDK